MRLLVFGSRNLTARHLDVMVAQLQALATTVPPDQRLVLIHGAGPRGTHPGAIGADMLSEVAAHLAWRGRERGVRRYPADPQQGESWGRAAIRRDMEMAMRPLDVALCFHTDPSLGKGSSSTAAFLARAGKRFRLFLLTAQGEFVREEER